MLEALKDTKEPLSLALCVPSMGSWKADFGLCFSSMLVHMAHTPFEMDQQRRIDVIDRRSSNLPRVRQECLEDAILKGATHALFMDSDQTFPHDTAHRLLAHKKQVVACNIALKTIPSFPTARNRGPAAFGVPVTSDPWKTGLEKVWRVGSGIMLVDLALVKQLPKPWFEITYDQASGQFRGEDWYFVEKLEKAGADIWIDHDLSRQIGHTGDFVYGHINIPQIEEKAAA